MQTVARNMRVFQEECQGRIEIYIPEARIGFRVRFNPCPTLTPLLTSEHNRAIG